MAGTQSDARFWDKTARKYAASTVSDPDGYERTLERTRAFLTPDAEVLEVGCGTGTTALKLAPFLGAMLATDISEEMLAIARERAGAESVGNIRFEVATPDNTAWPPASFDAALAFNLLHLVEDRAGTLANLNRVLKPGGVLISKTPCLGDMSLVAQPALRLAVPAMRLVGKAPRVFFHTAEKLEREMQTAGFEIVERGRHASKGKDIRLFLVARKV